MNSQLHQLVLKLALSVSMFLVACGEEENGPTYASEFGTISVTKDGKTKSSIVNDVIMDAELWHVRVTVRTNNGKTWDAYQSITFNITGDSETFPIGLYPDISNHIEIVHPVGYHSSV